MASHDTDGLVATLEALQTIGAARYEVLLTKVPLAPEPEGPQLRKDVTAQGISIFHVDVPSLKAFEKAATAGQIVNRPTTPAPAGRGKPTKPQERATEAWPRK